MGRSVAWIGIVLFAVAWFVPVHAELETQSELKRAAQEVYSSLMKAFRADERGSEVSMRPEEGTYSGPPGWRAFRFAWDLLTKPDEMPPLKHRTLLGLTSLTNLVMVLAVFALILGGGGALRVIGLLLLGCAFLNLGWTLWSDWLDTPGLPSVSEGLRAGYWLWVLSFAMVGLSFVMKEPEAA